MRLKRGKQKPWFYVEKRSFHFAFFDGIVTNIDENSEGKNSIVYGNRNVCLSLFVKCIRKENNRGNKMEIGR